MNNANPKEKIPIVSSNRPVEKIAEELEKEAASASSFFDTIKAFVKNPKVQEKMLDAGTYAAGLGMVGIGVASARGMGGMVSRMMSQKQLDESFQTVMQDNEDLRNIPNARAYFDVVARHSPSLANDPMVAPQLIRNFDSFGGVDVNTVGKLREIENTGKPKDNGGTNAFDIIGGMNSLKNIVDGGKQDNNL